MNRYRYISPMDPILKRELVKKTHLLKPIVMIGKAGLSTAVLAELEQALLAHELVKIKINAEKEDRQAMIERLCQESKAELIIAVGHTACIYRKNEDKEAEE